MTERGGGGSPRPPPVCSIHHVQSIGMCIVYVTSPSNKTVALPTCYCKQKRATGSSDWSTVLKVTLMSSDECKS